MEVGATSDSRGEDTLTLPVSSPLAVESSSVDVTANDPVVDNNDNSNTVDKEEEFMPDTPTSCISINTIQVRRALGRKGGFLGTRAGGLTYIFN